MKKKIECDRGIIEVDEKTGIPADSIYLATFNSGAVLFLDKNFRKKKNDVVGIIAARGENFPGCVNPEAKYWYLEDLYPWLYSTSIHIDLNYENSIDDMEQLSIGLEFFFDDIHNNLFLREKTKSKDFKKITKLYQNIKIQLNKLYNKNTIN